VLTAINGEREGVSIMKYIVNVYKDNNYKEGAKREFTELGDAMIHITLTISHPHFILQDIETCISHDETETFYMIYGREVK